MDGIRLVRYDEVLREFFVMKLSSCIGVDHGVWPVGRPCVFCCLGLVEPGFEFNVN